MQLEKATSHSGEAGLAGWISSNDVTLFTVVLVVVIAIFLQTNVIKGSKRNESLTDQNRRVEAEIKRLTAELTARRNELAQTNQELRDATAALEDTRRRLAATDQKLQATQRDLDAANRDKAALDEKRNQLDRQLADVMKQVQALQASLDALNVDKARLLAATEQLTRDKDELAKQKDSLTKTKADLDTNLADLTAKLQQRLKDLDDLQRERDLLEQQATALAERVQRLEQQLGTNQKDMAELKKTSDAETASLRELLARALAQAKTDKTTAEQQLQAAAARLAEIEAQAKAAGMKVADYLDRLQRAAIFVRGLDEKKRLLELEVEALKVQLANALDRLQNSQQELTQRRTQVKTINQALVGLTGKLRRVAILFDSSGSMLESGRWDEVQRIAATWLAHLEFDQCVLIVFSGQATAFPADGTMTSVSGPQGDANRARLLAYLKSVQPEGWTNTLAAMQLAYQYPDLDSIILFSDGAPTYDNSNKFNPEMAQQIYDLCRQHPHVPVNAIGLGNYFDRDLSTFLRTLAETTGGTFLGR